MLDVEGRLKPHKRIHANIRYPMTFTGVPPGALWDATKFGMSHMRDWGRIPLVTEGRT